MNHYVYYSYEEWGRGYIGSRSCSCPIEEDSEYMGSYSDKTFRPSGKVILYVSETREDCNRVECLLHDFFEVDINPKFANLSRQRSSGFYRSGPHKEETICKIKTNRKGRGLGPSPHPAEHFREIGRRGGLIGSRNQLKEDKKKGGDKCKDQRLGFFSLSEEENKAKSSKAARVTNQQVWECTKTGKRSTARGLSRWQNARGIDTKNRIQVYPEAQRV